MRPSIATGSQGDGSWRVSEDHTLRAGYFIQGERSTSQANSQVIALNDDGSQVSDTPISIFDSGAMEPSQTRDSTVGAVDMLLRAGADDGTLRSDVQADDVVSSLIGIFLASGSPEQTGRLLDLLAAGVAR